MTVGKPDFNLNSFGVKYLSKDEVQEFLEKRTQGESIRSQGETRTRPLGTSGKPMDSGARQAGQHRGSTAGLKQGEFTPSLAGRNQIDATLNTPKPEAEKPATATSSTISAPNAAGDKKLQSGTRSQFMSREDTTPKSNYAKQLASDIKESGGKVDESGIISRGGDQSVSAQHKGKRVPAHRIMPLHGKNPDGSNTDGSKETVPDKPKQQALGTTIGRKNTGIVTESGNPSGKEIKELSDEEKRVNEDEKSKKQTGGSRKGIKRLPKHTGDAPEGVKSETELVGGRNTQVGVGVKANEQFKKNPQGELTESQKPVDPNKKDKRVKDLNDQNPRSPKGRAHTTRTRENMKYYNEDQKTAYGKIDPKDRNAQSKFHDEQDKKYGKSVSTPKKLSTAGQAIKDKLKKSNDIILDMNIMKLDLNKISTFKPKMNKRGGRILNPDSDDDRSFGEIRAQEEVRVQNEKDKLSKLGKSADETIFKAISLKLDLMKTRKLNNSPLESVSRLTPKQRKIEADKFLQDTTQYTPKQRKARENAAWEQKDRQNKETQEIYDATFPENR